MATTARQSDYITEVRQLTRQFWMAYQGLRAMQDEWHANDYTSTLETFEGENSELEATHISAVVFDTMDEVELRIFDTAHKTNLARLL